jgi:hypothetical protein
MSLTPMEYSIIKEKSYVLFIDLSILSSHIYVRRTWVPVVSVYSDEILNQKSLLPINPNRGEESFNVQELHKFIDDNNNKTLNKLKEKMIATEQFKLIFTKLVPLNILGSLEKIGSATNAQVAINAVLLSNDPSTVIAKSLKKNITNTIDKLLNAGEY